MVDGILFASVALFVFDCGVVGFLEVVLLTHRWLTALLVMEPIPVCSRSGCGYDVHAHRLRLLMLMVLLLIETRRPSLADSWLR